MAKKQKQTNMRRRGARKPAMAVSPRLRSHIAMVTDPCNAVLGHTAYRGSDGFVSRFKSNLVVSSGGATNNICVVAFYPAYNSISVRFTGDPNAALTTDYSTPGPGQAFLLGNSGAQRVVGACTQILYTGTELNRQGLVFRGVIPENVLNGASVNQLRVLCQHSSRNSGGLLETKFIPSSIDEEYWATGAAAPAESGDRNVIVTILEAPQNSTQAFNLVHTLIAEWRPKLSIGLQVPTPNTPDVPGGLERVRTALASMGDWWLNAAHTASTALVAGRKVYDSTMALSGVARLALM